MHRRREQQLPATRAQRLWLGLGFVMLGLVAYATWSTVPDRTAVDLEKEGIRAYKAERYAVAIKDFDAVLDREPRSAHARLGLACSFFLTGHRSRAALELTLAVRVGLPLQVNDDCGHHFSLSSRFLTAKFGLTGAFAAPRVPHAAPYERMLASEPAISVNDEAERFLAGSCLAFRAKLDGAAWYYAANAVELVGVDRRLEHFFAECMGEGPLRRLRCDHGKPLRCVISARIRHTYLIDRPYLHE